MTNMKHNQGGGAGPSRPPQARAQPTGTPRRPLVPILQATPVAPTNESIAEREKVRQVTKRRRTLGRGAAPVLESLRHPRAARIGGHGTVLETTSKFTDLVAVVGPNRQEFNLHRCIVCQKSNFFNLSCSETGPFQFDNATPASSSGVATVTVPTEITPNTFQTIVQWIYTGGYNVKEPLEPPAIIAVYKAATILQIPELQSDIFNLLTNVARRYRIARPTDKEDEFLPILENLLWIIEDICITLRIYYDCEETEGEGGQKSGIKNLLEANVFFDSYMDVVKCNVCEDCMEKFEIEKRKKCRVCRKDLVKEVVDADGDVTLVDG